MLNALKDGGGSAEVRRHSAGRQKQGVLRLLHGEPVDAVAHELALPIYRLWREQALAGIDAGPKKRVNDPVELRMDHGTQ